jgi:hypothetical protein
MTAVERVLIQFVCRRRGHEYARVVQNGPIRELVLPRMAYMDTGPRPGTVRHKLFEEEFRRVIPEPGTETEHWSMPVLCKCGLRRGLFSSDVAVQLGEWAKFNSVSRRPRVVPLDKII